MKTKTIIITTLIILLVILFFLTFSIEELPRDCEEEGVNKVMCSADEAVRTGNFELCEQFIEVNKTICYTTIGINLKSTQVCENLGTKYDIDFCYSNVLEEMDGIEDCEKLEGEFEIKCVAYLSLYTLASGECESQEQENQRDLCFKLIAEILDEAGICDKVDEQHTGLCEKYLNWS